MPRQKGVTRLELLRRKQTEIAEQLKTAEAREREREKQLEARRKDLLGAALLEYLKAEPGSPLSKSLIELLAHKLTRPADRALFPDLPSRPAAGKARKTSPDAAPARLNSAQPGDVPS